jgi:excisionase family DNA binding protein
MTEDSSPQVDRRPPLTVAQFADRFNLPRSTAYLMVTQGRVAAFRIGTRVRIPAAVADAFEAHALGLATAADVRA